MGGHETGWCGAKLGGLCPPPRPGFKTTTILFAGKAFPPKNIWGMPCPHISPWLHHSCCCYICHVCYITSFLYSNKYKYTTRGHWGTDREGKEKKEKGKEMKIRGKGK